MKKFKTEAQKVLDLMINSIYTHKEIFMRELVSNASDAIDKLYYKSLEGGISGLAREDFAIEIKADKENRTVSISDNGIGMTEEELDKNLGVIARSGSREFKENTEKNDEIGIIGQFGVGFYSAFMVSDKVEVFSKAHDSERAYVWTSNGSDGYDIKECEKENHGSTVVLHLRKDTEEENYSKFLEEYELRALVKKYSDYIRYPIKMETTQYRETEGKEETYTATETLNSMTPIWKKSKKDVTKEEYEGFYRDTFFDYEAPARVIHASVEGKVDYKALLFIPSHPSYDFYTKNFEKGLKLYTDGVLITDCCKDLLPDYFSFVKGLVDSQLTLNVSRETIQHNSQLRFIANNIEKKIKSELLAFMESDREGYVKFYKGFARQLKFGLYESFGQNKDVLVDLLMFHSIKENKQITFKEYVEKMLDSQKGIYYATGSSPESIKELPLCEKILDDGYDILCMTEEIDEFVLKILREYDGKEFKAISAYEDSAVEEVVENKALTDFIKETLGDKVTEVKLSSRLKSHPVCLSVKGDLSMEMERVLKMSPDAQEGIKAEKVLELNANHALCDKLQKLFDTDKEKLKAVSEILYNQALLIEGMTVENPTKLATLVCDLI